ncbi:hypothetical protein Sste5346_004168 [Sporothrix stenoceras]|uniref:Uncharacterized protein n=1 Tax=Sporothrix stenoceras TaxID=5173 RepID=A0ABR3ZBK1_9PEZI
MASHDDLPPPPYSETDIYSQTAGDNHSTAGRSTTAASAVSTTTSSPDDEHLVVYTPPASPPPPINTDINNFQRPNAVPVDVSPSPGYGLELGPEIATAAASAAAYFATRPPPPPPPGMDSVDDAVSQRQYIVYDLPFVITTDTTRADLSFPATQLLQRDVRADDWQTFVSYLLPHSVAEKSVEGDYNNAVIDRKLRAEDDSHSPSAEHLTSLRTRRDRSEEGGIQLIDTEAGDQPPHLATQSMSSALPRQQQLEVAASLRQWNDGFFGPRGVIVRFRDDLSGARHEQPQQWTPSPVDAAAAASLAAGGSARPNTMRPSGSSPTASTPGGSSSSPVPGISRQGTLSIAGMTIDGDRVVFGNNRFVADRTGLRIGGLTFDERGISYGNRTIIPAAPPPPTGPGVPGVVGSSRGVAADAKYGGVATANANAYPPPPRRRGSVSSVSSVSSESSESSQSSSSSGSSSSSSDSQASVGSLPPYNKLDDRQLPAAHAYLQQWLNHPEQPITRDSVQAANKGIMSADEKGDPQGAPPAYPGPTVANTVRTVSNPAEASALRVEVKVMMKQWKDLKRRQKQMYRQERRNRKHMRRERKRERRAAKRQGRQERIQLRRQHKQERREERRQEKQMRKEGRRSRRRGGDGPVPVTMVPPVAVAGGFGVPTPGYAPHVPHSHYGHHNNHHQQHQYHQVHDPHGHRYDRHYGARGDDAGYYPPSVQAPGVYSNHGVPGVPGVPGVGGVPGVPGVPGAHGLFGVPGVPGQRGSPSSNGARIAQQLGEAVASRFGPRVAGLGGGLVGGMFGRGGPMGGFGRGASRGGGWGGHGNSSFGGFGRSRGFGWGSEREPEPAAATTSPGGNHSDVPPTTRSGASPTVSTAAAKYREAEAAEQAMAEKQTELAEMQESLERMINSRGERGEEDPKVQVQRRETEQLANEVEMLAQHVELLRLDADQTYARELEKGGK